MCCGLCQAEQLRALSVQKLQAQPLAQGVRTAAKCKGVLMLLAEAECWQIRAQNSGVVVITVIF